MATGFNRCNVTSGEGGSIDAEYLFRYAVERASTTAQTWLGLTAGCAVCHDHKYDPISAKEFYSLYAFFHSSADPAMDGNALLTSPVMKVKPDGFDAKLKEFDDTTVVIQKKMTEKTSAVTYADPAEQNPKPPVTKLEQVWFDDAFPEGAQVGASGHPTTFVDTPVASGKKSLKRGGAQTAQDYYQAGAQPLEVPQDGKFFVHVYLDPADPPEEVMIQFNSGDWKHRALWGEDVIEFGAKNTTERFKAGMLPPLGKWTKLEVDAAKMGLTKGVKIIGYAFTVHGGTAFFDKMGVEGRVDPATDPALSLAKGFVYIINNANFPGGIQAVLHLLDTYGDTKVIANPHLGALDNQKATIKSGERIPINQQTNVGGTINGVVTTTSQYIDTGVLLQVTPHINAGGLVTLEVQAEVSDPGNFVPGEAPPINTRSVQTTVSVQSGQTMVMGGLIGETKQLSSSGLPLLSRIPIIGGLFGEQTLKNNRTELIMFITPRVVENEFDVKNVIDDLRRRMGRLDEEFPRSKVEAQPTKPPATAPP